MEQEESLWVRVRKDAVWVELGVLAVVMIVLLIVFSILVIKRAEAETIDDYCFNKYHNTPYIKPLPPVLKKGRYRQRLRTFRALVAHTRRTKKALTYYRTKRLRPRVTWGTYGFDKSVAVIRHRSQLDLALTLAMGVELSSILKYPENILGDLDFHYRIAREMRCLQKKGGYNITAFPVYIRLPLK